MELLIWLNILSNRSFNDLSQYPVFPWIITQYQDKFTQKNEEISLQKNNLSETISQPNQRKDSYLQSNSGDTKSNKSRTGSFLKKLGKKKASDDIKSEDSNINMTNKINSIDVIEKRNSYDQFNIKDKKSQIILDKDIRNFSLPMGMMSLNEAGEKRKNNYLEKFSLAKKESSDNSLSETSKIYIYGSHYSNPLYVCHYLTRVFPFTNIQEFFLLQILV